MGSFFVRRQFMAGFFQRKKKHFPFCSVVVAAAGSSTRMEGQDKMFAELDGMPVLARTLLALERCALLSELVIVARSEMIPVVGQLCQNFALSKAAKVVAGGDTRTQSVLRGVSECSPRAELIAIHDGARPLISQEELEEVLRKGAETGAAAPAVPVKDTIKEAEKGLVTGTPDRSRLFAIQTPQVFEASLIKAALTKAEAEKWTITDDCSAVERLGMKVSLTQGTYENIKITTPVDLILGEAILNWREQG